MLGLLTLALALFPVLEASAAVSARASRRRLDEVSSRLEEKKREIERYRGLQRAAELDLDALEREKDASARVFRDLQVKSRAAEGQSRVLSEEVGAVARAHDQSAKLMAEELREYRRGAVDRDLGGRGGLWEDAFRRAALKEKTVYLARLQVFHRSASAAEAAARARDRELKARAREAAQSLRSREDSYEKRREDYREVQKKITLAQRELRELEETKKDMARLLEGLRAKKPARQAAARPRMAVPRKSLPWPVPGRVVTRFGKQQVPALGTWVIRNGVEIEAQPRALVRPVGPGKVIFVGPFRSYGNLMIVEHEVGFHSVYGRLGAFLKRKGDPVNPAVPIAMLGSDPAAGTLYLEIRQDGDALDPLSWLQERQP